VQQPKSNPPPAANAVVIADTGLLRVPSLIGLPVRKVVELAGAAGLEVVIDGNGTAREQAPAPGTMVAPGTKIVARCAH
jgi:cell division protein FtsI (penicillin-binding protein 3)